MKISSWQNPSVEYFRPRSDGVNNVVDAASSYHLSFVECLSKTKVQLAPSLTGFAGEIIKVCFRAKWRGFETFARGIFNFQFWTRNKLHFHQVHFYQAFIFPAYYFATRAAQMRFGIQRASEDIIASSPLSQSLSFTTLIPGKHPQ